MVFAFELGSRLSLLTLSFSPPTYSPPQKKTRKKRNCITQNKKTILLEADKMQ